jgi:hypothetical protein
MSAFERKQKLARLGPIELYPAPLHQDLLDEPRAFVSEDEGRAWVAYSGPRPLDVLYQKLRGVALALVDDASLGMVRVGILWLFGTRQDVYGNACIGEPKGRYAARNPAADHENLRLNELFHASPPPACVRKPRAPFCG